MNLSLRYMLTKTLTIDPTAYIADEFVAPLKIEWVGSASTRFASHAGFLYFVSSEQEVPSPALDPATVFGCLVPQSLQDLCRGIPRIVVSDECNLDDLFTLLVREIERYRAWHETINELLLADAPYQDIMDATAQFVPRPMYVADASWRMISRVDFEMSEISATWHYQIQHDGLYPLHIVEALNRTGDYRRISNLPRAALIDSEVYTMRILAKPIRMQGKLVGYYFIIDTWGDLGYCEVEIAQELGSMIAPLMASRSAREGRSSSFQDSLILHMLDGAITSHHEIAEQLKRETFWSITSDYRLVSIRFNPSEFENHLLHMRTMGMLMGDFDSHAYAYNDMAIAIFHEAEQERDDFMEHLQKCAEALKRVVVVSSRFSDFSQLTRYFDTNVRVHEGIERDEAQDPCVISCDTMFRHLLADCCRNKLTSCYAADMLHDYDKKHHTPYCETLLVYLVCERNAVATANSLFLHRNTLRNRLNKIESIVNMNLDNVDERMHLMIALNSIVNNKA